MTTNAETTEMTQEETERVQGGWEMRPAYITSYQSGGSSGDPIP